MRRHLALAGLLILLAGLASAADLTGDWKGAFAFQDQSVPLTFALKGDAVITGSITGMPSGAAEIKDGKLDGDKLTFWTQIEYQGMPVKLVFRGTVSGSEIKFEFGTEDGSWGTQVTAKKA